MLARNEQRGVVNDFRVQADTTCRLYSRGKMRAAWSYRNAVFGLARSNNRNIVQYEVMFHRVKLGNKCHVRRQSTGSHYLHIVIRLLT